LIAFMSLETNQTETGKYYCVRLGWMIHPKMVAIVKSLIEWF
jgi:hypothetical protein